MNRPAIRFLGHMSSRSSRLAHGVAKRNVFQVVLEAGVNVSELVGEVISYNETLKQSAYIMDSGNLIKEVYMKKVEEQTAHHKEKMNQIQDEKLIELQIEERQLQRELEVFKQKRETQMLLDVTKLDENIEAKTLAKDMLKTYNKVLSLCYAAIEETVGDDENKQWLLEEYRKNQRQINMLIREIF